jgi:hypothetical protein
MAFARLVLEVHMYIRALAKLVYGLVALAFLAAGGGLLLLGTGLLPGVVSEFILKFGGAEGGGDGDLTMHLLQEGGALLVLVGLVNAWCVLHYPRSLYFHWAMTVFWALFAIVHWFDYRGHLRAGTGPIANSVPLFVFALIGTLRMRSEREPAPSPAGAGETGAGPDH